MLISENWLKNWVDSELDSAELAETLTLAGLEVEGITPASGLEKIRANRSKIVVGRIEQARPHPDADKLRICDVSIGKRSTLEIVCGASNADPGCVVPVALVGAKLPKLEIKTTTIRGVISNGMLCSSAELGLSDAASGLMHLDADAPLGKPLWKYLDLDDNVVEIDLTPNRGDCLCVQGVAREISVLTGAKMASIEVPKVKPAVKAVLPIKLEAPEGCPRFVGRVVHGIDMQARTPDWMQHRLLRSGVRSINPVVDITNYVMLETGQPMHAYDLDKVSGGIIVRRARKKEKLKLLDDSTVILNEQNLVIADHKKAVGLAGIMGGDSTAISDTTTSIFFEAAFFPPADIIGKARQLGMHTDASHRFERGVSPVGQSPAIERATALLLEIAGGQPGKICHEQVKPALPKRPAIKFNSAELPRILGIKIPATSIRSILKRLGMVVSGSGAHFKVVPPQWRFDITGQHDLIEEIGRCYGYEKIEPVMPAAVARTGGYPETRVSLDSIKQILVSRGYFEAISYSFIAPEVQSLFVGPGKSVRLQNPLADNMSVMRRSLLPGLVGALQRNLNRQENSVRLFESGRVFEGTGKRRKEIDRIAAVLCGSVLPRQWSESERAADFYDMKGDLEAILDKVLDRSDVDFVPAKEVGYHPGQCAHVLIKGKVCGTMGSIHPEVLNQLDIDKPVFALDMSLDAFSHTALPQFTSLSKYPSIERDLAVVVDQDVAASKILRVVRENAGNHLKSLQLFDIYAGEKVEKNKKSFAFSLTFQSESSSLKAGDVDDITNNIITALEAYTGARLRS